MPDVPPFSAINVEGENFVVIYKTNGSTNSSNWTPYGDGYLGGQSWEEFEQDFNNGEGKLANFERYDGQPHDGSGLGGGGEVPVEDPAASQPSGDGNGEEEPSGAGGQGGETGGSQGAGHDSAPGDKPDEEKLEELRDKLQDAKNRLAEVQDQLSNADSGLSDLEDQANKAEELAEDIKDAADTAGEVAGDIDETYSDLDEELKEHGDPFADPSLDGPPPDDVVIPTNGGEPVRLFSGAYIRREFDVQMPACGMNFMIQRVYHSQSYTVGLFGPKWRLNFEDELRVLVTGKVVRVTGESTAVIYTASESGGYVSPDGWPDLLEQHGNGWRVVDASGGVREFDSEGHLMSISDRFGNTISLNYNNGRLNEIIDSSGRRYKLRFNSESLVGSIIDSRSREIKYSYSGGRLVSVEHPGPKPGQPGPFFSYEYEDGSDPRMLHQLIRVSDRNDNTIIRNTYGTIGTSFGRITRQEFEAGEYNYSYLTGNDDDVRQRTIFQDRRGIQTEFFFDANGRLMRKELVNVGMQPGSPIRLTTQYFYSDRGLVRKIIYPEGQIIEFEYDEGNPDPLARNNLLTKIRKHSSTSTRKIQRFQYGLFNGLTRIEDEDKSVTTFVLDSLGRRVEMHEPDVEVHGSSTVTPLTRWEYNANGLVTKQVNPRGLEIRLTYYASGHRKGLLRHMDLIGGGQTIQSKWRRDSDGEVTQHIQNGQDKFEYNYDLRSRPESLVRNGYEIQRFEYDTYDRITRVAFRRIEPDGSVSTPEWVYHDLNYDVYGRLVETSTTNGTIVYERVTYGYDGENNVVEVVGPGQFHERRNYEERGLVREILFAPGTTDESRMLFEYDPVGNLIATTDPNGHRFEQSYDVFDRLSGTLDPFGNSESISYLDRGRKKRIDRFDAAHNLVSRVELERNIQQGLIRRRVARLTATGNVGGWMEELERLDEELNSILHVGPTGLETKSEYDMFGREIKRVDSFGNRLETNFNSAGLVASQTRVEKLADGSEAVLTTNHTWDAESNLIATKDSVGREERYQIDKLGQIRTRYLPDGSAQSYEYDALGRVVVSRSHDSSGGNQYTERFDYDAQGLLTAVVDAKGNRTSFKYDHQGRQKRVIDAAGKTRYRFDYDKNGNRIRIRDPRGFDVNEIRDALGRVTSRIITGPSGAIGATQESFAYDALGNLILASNDFGEVHQTFNSLSRPVSSTLHQKTIQWDHHDNGVLHRISYPSGLRSKLDRDRLGRVTKITTSLASGHSYPGHVGSLGSIANYEYSGRSIRQKFSCGNGIEANWTYDVLGRPFKLIVGGTTSTAFEETSLRDGSDRVILFQKAASPLKRVKYDDRGMLLETAPVSPNAQLSDLLQKLPIGPPATTSQSQNDIINVVASLPAQGSGEISLEYDEAGNRTRYEIGGVVTTYKHNALNQITHIPGQQVFNWDTAGNLQDDGIYHYEYDFANRLCRVVQISSGIEVYSAEYDPLGRPIKIVEHGTERLILYDKDVPIELLRSDGSIERVLAWGPGQDELLLIGTGNETYFAVPNLHGDVALLTDHHGSIVETYRYGLFGDRIVLDASLATLNDSTIDNKFGYNGRPHLLNSSLIDLRARHLSPSLARFLSMDPAGHVATVNLYVYAGNSPLSWIDLDGQRATIVGGALGFAWGVGWAIGSSVYDATGGKGVKGIGHYASQVAQFTLSGAMIGAAVDLGRVGGGVLSAPLAGGGMSGFISAFDGSWSGFATETAGGAALGLAVWGATKLAGKGLAPMATLAAGTGAGSAVLQVGGRLTNFIGGTRIAGGAMAAIAGARNWVNREGSKVFAKISGTNWWKNHSMEIALGDGAIPIMPVHAGWRAGGEAFHAAGAKPLNYLTNPGKAMKMLVAGTSLSKLAKLQTIRSTMAESFFGEAGTLVIPMPALNPNLAANLSGRSVLSCLTSTWNAWSRANYHLPNGILGLIGGNALLDGLLGIDGIPNGGSSSDFFNNSRC